MPVLLTRDQFREAVLARDGHKCVWCGYDPRPMGPAGRAGLDAHHIMERRLWPDGGYYLDNGVTLCSRPGYESCHLKAEQTVIDTQSLRDLAGIRTVLLPPHLYPDEVYDKWGNVILPSGARLKGELYEDPSVQKVLKQGYNHPNWRPFTSRVKYPRTYHLPWSASVTADDRTLDQSLVDGWAGTEVVITEKMDGENTAMYRDYLHARSLDYTSHISRDYVKALHARIAHEIPPDWRICGENLWAKHSIGYQALRGYFLVFSIWEGFDCLSWDETAAYAELLDLPTVPILKRGVWPVDLPEVNPETSEGYVIRPAERFRLAEFPTKVGKYVRKNHVQTHGHWMRFTQNGLA